MPELTTLRKPVPFSIEQFLAPIPDHLKAFFRACHSELPTKYVLSADGISLKNSQPGVAPVFCSPLRPRAALAKADGTGWSTIVEILNPDNKIVDCVIPWDLLEKSPKAAIAKLANQGFRLSSAYHHDLVLDMLRNWRPVLRQTELDHFGWTPDRDAFVLSTGRILARAGTSDYRFEGVCDAHETGDLATWRDRLAALAPGNANLLFACALGFSTALLEFSPSSSSVIYHLYQKTSKGKTRILRAGLSIWPKVGKGDKVWTATANGLEGEMARSNSLLLGLDELPGTPLADFGNVIYMIGNGAGKGRAAKDGTAVKRQTWKTSVISTGETSMVATLAKLDMTPRGGQGVRMIDIPAGGVFGVFDDLHGHADSDKFLATLDKSIAKASGPAGLVFVQELLQQDADAVEQRLEIDAEVQAAALQDALGIVSGDQNTTEIRRVLHGFAIVAVAGEWASEWGITGWQPGAAAAAVIEIARRWLAARGTLPDDMVEAIKKTRDYLRDHEALFVPLSKQAISTGNEIPSDYRDEEFFYLTPATLEKIYEKTGRAAALAYLEEAKFLEPGGEKRSKQVKISTPGGLRERFYKIARTILDFDEKKISPGATAEKSMKEE